MVTPARIKKYALEVVLDFFNSLPSSLLGITKDYSTINLVNGIEVVVFTLSTLSLPSNKIDIKCSLMLADRNDEVRFKIYRDGIDFLPNDIIFSSSGSTNADSEIQGLYWVDENTIANNHEYTVTAQAENNNVEIEGYKIMTGIKL